MIDLSQKPNMLKLFEDLQAKDFINRQISKKIEEYGFDQKNINWQDFAQKLISNGLSLSANGKYDESEMCFYCVTALDANYAAEWLARVLRGEGDPLEVLLYVQAPQEKNSIKIYDKILSIHPQNTRALIWKGFTLDERHKFDEGSNCYRKAIEINPRSVWLLTNAYRVTSLVKQDHKNAVKMLDSLLRISKDQPFLKWMMGQEMLAMCLYEEALAYFNLVLQIESDNADVLSDKGMALDGLHRLDEALDCFDRSIEIDPNLYVAIGNRGVVLQELGRNEEAIESYQKSINMEPNNSNAKYNLARLKAEKGNFEEALELLEKAILLDRRCKERAKNAPEFKTLKNDDRFKQIIR